MGHQHRVHPFGPDSPPRPLTCRAVPQRCPMLPHCLHLPHAMLQPPQPQTEFELLLAPVEAEGQVVVLGWDTR